MGKRILLFIGLFSLCVFTNSVYAVPTYTNIGTATNESNPSVWQTFNFNVTPYISGATNATLYLDLRNDWPNPPYSPDATTAQVLFGTDVDFLGDYFAHFDYYSGSDTNHYRNVWLDIDGVKYVDQWGPYNDHLGLYEGTGTSICNPNERVNIKGANEPGWIPGISGQRDYDATTYWLTKLIEVTTTQSYISETISLGSELSFDYWWKMGQTSSDFNLDILYLLDGKWNSLLGWEINFKGTSPDWQTATFTVPDPLRGLNTQIRFGVLDLGVETDPTLYLRDIKSSTAPVPEPTTMLLLGTGLISLAGLRKKSKKQ